MMNGYLFRIGDLVEPKECWRADPNQIPSGAVRSAAPWGKCGAFYVGDDHRAFAADVFQRVGDSA